MLGLHPVLVDHRAWLMLKGARSVGRAGGLVCLSGPLENITSYVLCVVLHARAGD